MAESLGISPKTIERHRKNIIKKFGIEGKVAFRKALRQIDRLPVLPER
jgi:DNA-binding CsgD family transcriptional regulator